MLVPRAVRSSPSGPAPASHTRRWACAFNDSVICYLLHLLNLPNSGPDEKDGSYGLEFSVDQSHGLEFSVDQMHSHRAFACDLLDSRHRIPFATGNEYFSHRSVQMLIRYSHYEFATTRELWHFGKRAWWSATEVGCPADTLPCRHIAYIAHCNGQALLGFSVGVAVFLMGAHQVPTGRDCRVLDGVPSSMNHTV